MATSGRGGRGRPEGGCRVALRGVDLGLGEEDAAGEVRAAPGRRRAGRRRSGRRAAGPRRAGRRRSGRRRAGWRRAGPRPRVRRRSGRRPGAFRRRPGARPGPARWCAAAARWPARGAPGRSSASERPPGLPWVRRSVSARARAQLARAADGPAARASASVRYQSSSWSCRITGKVSNICRAALGACAPVPAAEGDLGDLLSGAEAVVDGAAGEARSPQPGVDAAAEVRRPGWRRAVPAGLSTAKSAEAAKARATQHSPKQLPQSARRSDGPVPASSLSSTFAALLLEWCSPPPGAAASRPNFDDPRPRGSSADRSGDQSAASSRASSRFRRSTSGRSWAWMAPASRSAASAGSAAGAAAVCARRCA